MKTVRRESVMKLLRKLGSRASLLLTEWLKDHKGHKAKVSSMINEAFLGGHQIQHAETEEAGAYSVWVTQVAWMERRKALLEFGAVVDERGELKVDDRTVIGITNNGPKLRTFQFASPWAPGESEFRVMDFTNPDTRKLLAELMVGRDFKAWSEVPCLLSDKEQSELYMLDLVYRTCLDLNLAKQKFMHRSEKNVQKMARIEQERTKGTELEFSGRPDDGHEGYEGGGLILWPMKEHKDRVEVKFESAAWSMDTDVVKLNGLVVPRRPGPEEFSKDLAWGWNCRLDLTTQMVTFMDDIGEQVWLDMRSKEYKALPASMRNKLKPIPVLKADAVRVERTNDGVHAHSLYGKPKKIEPIGLIRRHLHNLIQLGHASYVFKPYVCHICNGYGVAPMMDEFNRPYLVDGQPQYAPCGRCYGSGAGAPGYHMDYETGLCVPNHRMAIVHKPEQFACRGKKAPCGNRLFRTDIHAEVCIKCGAEMWKNSLIMLFPGSMTSDAFELPEGATHSGVQVYGQLVKDIIHARVKAVNSARLKGLKISPRIGTKLSIHNGKLHPNVMYAMDSLSTEVRVDRPVMVDQPKLEPQYISPKLRMFQYRLQDRDRLAREHKEHMFGKDDYRGLHWEITNNKLMQRLRDRRAAAVLKLNQKLNQKAIQKQYKAWSKKEGK